MSDGVTAWIVLVSVGGVSGSFFTDQRPLPGALLLLRSASVKRKPCRSPTKNCCANLTPLRLCRYFNHNHAGFVASYIVQRDVKVASSSARKSTTRPVRDTISVQTGLTATGFGLSGSAQSAVANAIAKTENARSSNLI